MFTKKLIKFISFYFNDHLLVHYNAVVKECKTLTHNCIMQGRKNLMKNKKKFAFLALAMTMGMVLGACNKPAESSSSDQGAGSAGTSAQVVESSSSSSSSEEQATLVSITVTPPTKVAYSTEDTALDLAGMVVTANYSDNTTNVISQGYTVSQVDFSTPGEKTVTVTFEGKTDTFTITVTAPVVLASITVTAPTKVAYTTADTALDLTGMVVTANYSDNTTQVITEGYTVSAVDFTTPGEKTVTVTFNGKTDTFVVTVANQKFTVSFIVEGVTVQTGEVEQGQTATYNGETPTKAADANASKYRFKGWDKDISQPITENTTFTAQFAAYAEEQVVDNFESYESNNDMADAWTVQAYTTAWGDTAAAVSIGSKATQGSKSLRFDGWENGTGFRFLKHNEVGAFSKAANAIKFNLQIPSINTVKVILKGKATIMGQVQEPSFTYEFHPTSDEYTEYVIPLAASEWQLWGEAGKTIQTAADMIGINIDDVVNYITDVGFFVQGKNDNNLPYFAFVDYIRFVTIDEPAAKSEVETMGQYTRYTGLLNDGHTVKVELGANGAATATVVDMETPQQIPGNVAIDANKNMTFTSADSGATLVYKAQLKNGGQSMKFVEAGGALAAAVTGVDLNAVQVVDNYDQYTSDGKSYYQSNMDMNARSGCRGAYYSEYYSGGSHEYETFGGNGWVLMASDGSQLKLKTDGGHSGTNYVCMKNSQYNAMRYMQWGLFDGTSEQNNFRGSKLSFWAKTNGLVKAFQVSMYYQTKPRNATKDQYVSKQTFTQTEAIGQWKHFEVDLNPAYTYYGFLVFMDHNDKADSYLYIDDVEVYTASPYATYVAPEPPVQDKVLTPGMTYIGKVAGLISAQLTIGKDNAVTLAAPGMAMNVNGTYVIAGDEVTMTLGDVQYVGTIEDNAINFKSVNGTGTIAGALNNLSFNMIEYADNAETYESDGKMYYQSNKDLTQVSGARGAYHCDYYTGGSSNLSPIGGNGWSLMGGSGDQLKLDKTTGADGSQSLQMKFSTAGNMRYLQWGLADGSAVGHTGFNKFGIYLKNTNANAVSIKLYAYHIQKVEPSTQGDSSRAVKEITVPANSDWTLYSLDLNSAKTYYGYGIYMVTKSATGYLNVDKAFYYNDYESPEMNFFAKNGLAISGNITAGPASMTFGQNGAVTLNCAALGGDLAGTYEMAMGETSQEITIKTSMGNITGTYSVNPAGQVTLTVTAVTGDLAAGVNVGAVLSNQ